MSDPLFRYENQEVVPMVTTIGAQPYRQTPDPKPKPLDIGFLVNKHDEHVVEDDVATWDALRVVFCDRSGRSEVVFRLQAKYALSSGVGWFSMSEIRGVFRLVKRGDLLSWYDPLGGRELFSMHDPARGLRNSWHVFRGGVLPLLYGGNFWFVDGAGAVHLQAQLFHQLRAAFEGLV